ncbi:MAG: winged helix-turn-helix transcriptional regulator [Actinomycetota bacterium]|nr:winged helix-turn-helix transcriptional regulator [Actinomycetota bacterium]
MKENDVFLKETEALHSLRALEEIEKNPKISQRELSNRLGVALGITNSLLKTLVRKGLIKIRGNNNRSLTYHLTHAGVLAKSKLAMQWTLNTIDFYRQARRDVAAKLAELAGQGVKSIALYGLGELTEIAAIVAPEAGLAVIGFVDGQASAGEKTVLGYPVISLEQLDDINPDAVVICLGAGDDTGIEDLSQRLESSTRLYRLI